MQNVFLRYGTEDECESIIVDDNDKDAAIAFARVYTGTIVPQFQDVIWKMLIAMAPPTSIHPLPLFIYLFIYLYHFSLLYLAESLLPFF